MRIPELDEMFAGLLLTERDWPPPLPDIKHMYKKYFSYARNLAHNLVCESCGCIFHNPSDLETVPDTYKPLVHLHILPQSNIPFNFSCG